MCNNQTVFEIDLNYCFNTTELGWQLTCLISTFFLLYIQWFNNIYYYKHNLKQWNQLITTHCKCFYITNKCKSVCHLPPTYNEIYELGLPSYKEAIKLTTKL